MYKKIPEWMLPRVVSFSDMWFKLWQDRMGYMSQLSNLKLNLPDDMTLEFLVNFSISSARHDVLAAFDTSRPIFENLQSFDLTHYGPIHRGIFDLGMLQMKKVKHLSMKNQGRENPQSLNLDSLSFQTNFCCLEDLSLWGYLSPYLFSGIRAMETLTKLSLSGVEGIVKLCDMPNLKVLHVCMCKTLVCVENFPCLNELQLTYCENIVCVRRLPMLTVAKLAYCRGLWPHDPLRGSTSMNVVCHKNPTWTTGLVLPEMPLLSSLSVNIALEHVVCHKNHASENLKELIITNYKFKKEEEEDGFQEDKITFVKFMNYVPRLEWLQLTRCINIHFDEPFICPTMGHKHEKMFTHLKQLELLYCSIRHLSCLPNLDFLVLHNCQISSDAVFSLPKLTACIFVHSHAQMF